MFKFLVVLSSVAYVYASGGYGALGGLGGYGGFGGGLGLAGGSGIGGDLGLASGGLVGSLGGGGGPVPITIATHRTYEMAPINTLQESAVPQILRLDVEPTDQPVQVIFRSASSPVSVQQIHTPGAPGQVESTQSEDEPHRLRHEVVRPVIQEFREVIQPYRRIVQEVRPVLEQVHTIVAKGERHGNGLGAGIGGGYGGGLAAAPVILDDGEHGGLVSVPNKNV